MFARYCLKEQKLRVLLGYILVQHIIPNISSLGIKYVYQVKINMHHKPNKH